MSLKADGLSRVISPTCARDVWLPFCQPEFIDGRPPPRAYHQNYSLWQKLYLILLLLWIVRITRVDFDDHANSLLLLF